MKKLIILAVLAVLAGGLLLFSGTIREFAAEVSEYIDGDPDMPFDTGMSKEDYMLKRAENIARLRGINEDHPFNPQSRMDAIQTMEQQESFRSSQTNSFAPTAQSDLLSAWTPLGPNPIPNGQTSGVPTAVSGRTIAIAVHPTNPNIVYVGTAQGGLFRSLDGGVTWTPMMDNALSLAIGAVAIAPSQPDTIYVGTGEPNFSADSFFGVGVYRIDNASTAPVTTGPLNKDPGNNDVFTGRAVGKIIVHPTNPDIIFVATTSGIGGLGGFQTSPLPNRGVYRSTNATSATPTFTQIGVLPSPNNNFNIRDIAIDPNDPNIMVANLVASGGGIYRSINALAASPTFTNVATFTAGSVGTANETAEFAAIHPVGDTNATFYAAVGNTTSGNGNGRVLKSTDGGATFSSVNTTAFCSPQCWYDIAVDVDPTNVNNVYIGGAPTLIFGRSTNGGTTFTANATTAVGLHSDSHVIAVAPSQPSTIYFGCDGGIYKSVDSGTTWTSLNNSTFSATQFMSIDTHPTDPNITIGGTQDNGTNRYTAAPVWTRTDFGDGGYAVIDQSSSDTATFNQYHTYFNASSLTGYAFSNSSTAFENWTFRGCQSPPGTPQNGISCTATINFYAPLERGPGTPNSIYYGADRLYRSVDTGLNNATVSQTFTSPISAIGISPQNDNVRIIGLNDGRIFGTTSGSSTLVDLDTSNTVPNGFVARAVIDPNDQNTSYVTLAGFGTTSVWKTNNVNAATPTWTAASGSGTYSLPQIPVNALVIDPLNSSLVYAGTDIGVYVSGDAGANWIPFGTGLPRVAVFDMAITSGRQLRIATHGRGLWQIPLFGPTAAPASIAGRVVNSTGTGLRNAIVSLRDNSGGVVSIRTNTFGYFRFASVQTGQTYVLSVQAKGYTFAPRALSLTSDLTDLIISETTAGSSVSESPAQQPVALSTTKVEAPTVTSKIEASQPVTSPVTKLTVVNTNADSVKTKRKLRKKH